MCIPKLRHLVVVLCAVALLAPSASEAGRPRASHEAFGHQSYLSPQSNPIAFSECATSSWVFAVSTTSNRVDVINAATNTWSDHVRVGMDPVALAVKPTATCAGRELWVSNHISDSVSVVDIDPSSASFLQIVETIQEVDSNGVSQFDEPVGIAFSLNSNKAYVALSSRNDVAVIDTTTYAVTSRLHITNQDPRALTVRRLGPNQGDPELLYVAAFESGNQTELSLCGSVSPGSQCTMDFGQFAVNLLAIGPALAGLPHNIVVDPDVPDRDVFVYNTSTDTLVSGGAVEHVGSLLYGIAVDSSGNAFVAQTEARNAANGLAALPPEGNTEDLVDLDNRLFLNQIGTLSCTAGGCGSPGLIELEPLPPSHPTAGNQLATPYGIAISDDDSTLVMTAAGSSRVFTVDTSSGTALDIADLGSGASEFQQIPRGVVLRSNATTGAPETAYVLNTLENTVSVIDVSNPSAISTGGSKINVGADPTPAAVRRGRIALNNANGSTTGTFSCGSCHPDGNTDQLLWNLGAQCTWTALCAQKEPRSTMPIRGLRDTLPLHWDGVPGDPFGGPNGEVGLSGSSGPNCATEHDCFRDLVDGGLTGVMCDQASGCPSPQLTTAERDDMADFLAVVSYPPARSRRVDDSLSVSALTGFEDFFMDQGGVAAPTTCADSDGGCHELPLGTATASESLGGFDSPTQRGLTDRYVQFSSGFTSTEEIMLASNSGISTPLFGTGPPNDFPYDPAGGLEEETTFGVAFAVFNPVYNVDAGTIFQMFEEASNGHPGALGRQVTLNNVTTIDPPGPSLSPAEEVLVDLEAADVQGVVNLRGFGIRFGIQDVPISRQWEIPGGAQPVDPSADLNRPGFSGDPVS
ncbi:MAG: hypothetical protein GY937_10995 [bacterium]|nr:hypothetical protein [bacterium]